MDDQNNSKKQSPERLNEIILVQSRLASADFDLDEFMELVVAQVEKLTLATGVVIELVDGDDMVYRTATGTVKEHIGLRLNRNDSISGLCVAQQAILRSDDTEDDSRVNKEACRRVHARSLVVTPLFFQGKAVGVLKILSEKPNGFTEEDVQTLQLMAGLIGSALAHQISHDETEKLLAEKTQTLDQLKKAEEKLTHMATFDHLTDLPNRYLFRDRLNFALEYAKRNKKKLALFFLDIDHFKKINDELGHAAGDLLLKQFAIVIKSCIRESDTAGRIGGDEFMILLNDIENENNAIMIADKIIKKMKEPFQFENHILHITTSIGITLSKINMDADTLIKEADIALYQAKNAGRNTQRVYTHQQ